MSTEPLVNPHLLAKWLDNLEPTKVPFQVNGNPNPENTVTPEEFNITLHKREIAVIIDALLRKGRR